MFRILSSSASSLVRLRTVAPYQSIRYMATGNSDLKDKALKAMLNSANPKNINAVKEEGEEDSKTTLMEKETPTIKPPPLVFQAPKPRESATTELKDPSPPESSSSSVDQSQTTTTTTTTAAAAATPLNFRTPPPTDIGMPPLHEFAPKIVVVGVGGAGNNALNNMIAKELLHGVDFLALNTDAQHLSTSLTDQRLQMGIELTRGLGAGANPDAGRMAAEESRDQIRERLDGTHMVFITSGMGGGTGTGASPVIADICQELGILTVGVVTLPFTFEGSLRKRLAMEGLARLRESVDTLITIPNQNLFRLAGPQTTFVDAFRMADDVLLGGVKSITDLMTAPGLINLDFADVQAVMVGMGNALLGTGVASGSNEDGARAVEAANMALDNPLLGSEWDISTAKGVLVNITGGADMTLWEVDQAAQTVTQQMKDENANIIFGSAFDERLNGSIRVSVVATGIEGRPDGETGPEPTRPPPPEEKKEEEKKKRGWFG